MNTTTKQPLITRTGTDAINRVPHLLLTFMLVLGLGLMGCEGPQGPQGEQGLAGEDGVDGQDGQDGNANVTLYIFDGHDFSSNSITQREITGLTETEMEESSWEVYLVSDAGDFFHIPGFGIGGSSEYGVLHNWLSASNMVEFSCAVLSGSGENYAEIRIIRTAVNNVNDQRSKAASLDYSNYEEVVEYYGLTDEDAVRISSQ